jgi:hypothetical protein
MENNIDNVVSSLHDVEISHQDEKSSDVPTDQSTEQTNQDEKSSDQHTDETQTLHPINQSDEPDNLTVKCGDELLKIPYEILESYIDSMDEYENMIKEISDKDPKTTVSYNSDTNRMEIKNSSDELTKSFEAYPIILVSKINPENKNIAKELIDEEDMDSYFITFPFSGEEKNIYKKGNELAEFIDKEKSTNDTNKFLYMIYSGLQKFNQDINICICAILKHILKCKYVTYLDTENSVIIYIIM